MKSARIDRFLLVFDELSIAYLNGPVEPVLDRFSLKIEAGTFLAIIGPSGCGKSSLLHATAGFIRPVGGSVRLGGHLIAGPSLQVGFVAQRYILFPWLTVEDNIAFGLRSQKRDEGEIRKRVAHFLEVIGLSPQRRYYPEQLSGGMQQRVALARAMAPEPPVLLLDEPFSALDTDTRQRMRELLLRLWTEHHTTILFVTHDIDEALLLADRVLILEGECGRTRIVDVPFPRPRIHALIHTKAFLNTVDEVSRNFGNKRVNFTK